MKKLIAVAVVFFASATSAEAALNDAFWARQSDRVAQVATLDMTSADAPVSDPQTVTLTASTEIVRPGRPGLASRIFSDPFFNRTNGVLGGLQAVVLVADVESIFQQTNPCRAEDNLKFLVCRGKFASYAGMTVERSAVLYVSHRLRENKVGGFTGTFLRVLGWVAPIFNIVFEGWTAHEQFDHAAAQRRVRAARGGRS